MPRKASGRHEAQRDAQAKYRAKLKQLRLPETQDLDTACASGIANLVQALEAGQRFRRSAAVLDFIVESAKANLIQEGFNADESGLLLRRRLTWLKIELSNPDASQLEKRGFKE